MCRLLSSRQDPGCREKQGFILYLQKNSSISVDTSLIFT